MHNVERRELGRGRARAVEHIYLPAEAQAPRVAAARVVERGEQQVDRRLRDRARRIFVPAAGLRRAAVHFIHADVLRLLVHARRGLAEASREEREDSRTAARLARRHHAGCCRATGQVLLLHNLARQAEKHIATSLGWLR